MLFGWRQVVACWATVNVSHGDSAGWHFGASYDFPSYEAQAPGECVTGGASEPQHCEQLHGGITQMYLHFSRDASTKGSAGRRLPIFR